MLERLIGDGVPHPTGSPGADAVRERVLAEFRRLGDLPRVETDFACSANGVCARVSNVVVERKGPEARKAILLSAHFDSVAAGPGASDDGMGVAALVEVARALSAAPHRRPIVFLIDDGEEQGLIGAEAFAASRRASDFLADVNLEARGTTGASDLFETSTGNAWLAPLFSAIPRPDASSLFYAIYKALPNDTDLTVFRRHGWRGVNFACIDGVARYHTPRDDLAHADPATLQHHGDNALAMARALDGYAGENPPPGDAVYFDLFAAGVARMPAGSMLPASIAEALLVFVAAAIARRRDGLVMPDAALGLLVVPFAMTAATAAGAAVVVLARAIGAAPADWVAHPFPILLASAAASLVAAGAAVRLVARPAGRFETRLGTAAGWVALAVLVSAVAPSAAFPLVIPAAAAVAALLPRCETTGDLAFRVLAGFFVIPLAWRLPEALGLSRLPAIAALAGLAATSFAGTLAGPPSRGRRRIGVLLAAAVVVSLAVSAFPAAFTSDSPRRLSILAARDADGGATRWALETDARGVPAALDSPALRREREFPWSPASVFAQPAPPIDVPPPLLRVLEDSTAGGERRLRVRVVSARRAPVVRLAFPPGSPIRRIAIDDVPVAIEPRFVRRAGGWKNATCVTVPPEGIEVEISSRAGPLELVLADRSSDLPPAAAPLRRARAVSAVPSQSGDGTVVWRRLAL